MATVKLSELPDSQAIGWEGGKLSKRGDGGIVQSDGTQQQRLVISSQQQDAIDRQELVIAWTDVGVGIEVVTTGVIDPKPIIFHNIPTTDPQIDNALWNDGGFLKLSTGE